MKNFLRAAGIALALAIAAPVLSGCAYLSRATNNEQVSTYDERALLTVELAYSFVLTVVNNAAAVGAVDQPTAERLLPALAQADAAVRRARALYDAGNTAEAALATQDAVAQVAALTALLEAAGLLRRAG